jgi:hypothetical protein
MSLWSTASILSEICLSFFLVQCSQDPGTSGPCEGIYCSGHGVCEVVNGRAFCDCDSGYYPDGLECIDVNCHFDCFDYTDCVDGVVIDYWGSPIPCEEWTGECVYQPFQEYRCEKGCSRDFVSGRDYFHTLSDACEENRPKSAGDTCVDLTDCQPPGLPGIFLDCDTNESICVEIPDPCEGVACSGHGQCEVDGNQAVCHCEAGFIPDGLDCIPEPSFEDFIAGAILDLCQENLPICTTSAGCVLEEDEYLEGHMPGFKSFIVHGIPGDTLVVKVFFRTQDDPGHGFTVTFFEPGCVIEISQGPLNDIFEEAGLDWTLEFSQGFVLEGDHLIEVSSDATTHYYLRVEVQ